VRANVTDRYYRTFTYQKADRVPDVEFGYWPQTLRRWLKEGMDLNLTRDETKHMFNARVNSFFGFDEPHEHKLGLKVQMNPRFEEEVIERRPHSTIVRDASGCTAERFLSNQEESSIPHFIDFPIKTPDDWAAMKEERYRIDDPARDWNEKEWAELRSAVGEGKMISMICPGPYGMLRNWMGFENLSIAFYEYPEMIHDMVDHITEMSVRQLRGIPPDIPVDHSTWWEDMASKNGPFVGPAMFREFLQPQYRRIQDELKKRGCCLGIVDCDGNPHDIVANWLEEGVNIMFPLEVQAGVDIYAWRREFGRELRLKGGIAKQPLVEGGSAIDVELERIRPMLEEGGYVPHLDHLVPPDVPYDNYRRYLEKKRELIGKEP